MEVSWMYKIAIPNNNNQYEYHAQTLFYKNASGRAFPILKYADDTCFNPNCVVSTSFPYLLPLKIEPNHNILVGKHNSIAMYADFNVGNNHNYCALTIRDGLPGGRHGLHLIGRTRRRSSSRTMSGSASTSRSWAA